MQWVEAIVHTTTEGSDLVSDLLMRCGAMGTQVLDRADAEAIGREKKNWELFDANIVRRMPEDVQVKGWFAQDDRHNLDTLAEQLAALKTQPGDTTLGRLSLEIATVADDDWAESWKRYYKPFRIGRHLIVKPTWEPYREEEGDIVIEMDPGMAFGTGTHETTNMCLVLLEKYTEKGMRVMDVGTGSGILAIAAAKLGAGKVLALDINPDAVRTAHENIARNGVRENTRVARSDMVRDEAMECDLVAANIVAGAVCVLAEPIKEFLKRGGYFICSGIIVELEQDVLVSLADAGYTVIDRLTQGEWVALCARREQ
jgi:ribosomal protein L11 methyltransferase